MTTGANQRWRLATLGTSVDLVVDEAAGSSDDFARALDFLSTHLPASQICDGDWAHVVGDDDSQVLATVYVTLRAGEQHKPPTGAPAEKLFLRKSASDFFTVPAQRVTAHGREYVHCTRTGSRMALDRQARRVDFALSPGGAMDLVELLRDLIIKHEESRGTVVLHATAAFRDGQTVLVAGAKAAGKSTLLLELVEHHGYTVLSGDKSLVVTRKGSAAVSGWPDYPHLGYGTIIKYPGLPQIAGLHEDHEPPPGHAFSPLGKFAIDPAPFRARFACAPAGTLAPLLAVLHPAIGPGNTQLTQVTDPAARRALLASATESAFDGTHAGWHHFVPDERARHRAQREHVLDLLAEVPAWTLTGAGDLTDDALPARLRQAVNT
jgi:hypothetical protein